MKDTALSVVLICISLVLVIQSLVLFDTFRDLRIAEKNSVMHKEMLISTQGKLSECRKLCAGKVNPA